MTNAPTPCRRIVSDIHPLVRSAVQSLLVIVRAAPKSESPTFKASAPLVSKSPTAKSKCKAAANEPMEESRDKPLEDKHASDFPHNNRRTRKT
ncbi:hypothetical protein MSAN_01312100 [Mycena sanguinolenta]|uniref:Uncharacterized protein n=1 Tax=Mycena sanguinolenta TaxID=230812 RepID=A0A8H7D093_9AGAR|nr:hypothetical protein MSAN_01312100 [Mycena sanguinolenta]